MTARESDGLPALIAAGGVTCSDGLPSTEGTLEISPSTMEVAADRGTTVVRLVTPKVQSVTRDVYGCATLRGAEFENTPTTQGACYASHWDQRILMNELMAPISSHTAVYSALTLAALEDSGWYRANYSVTEPLIWGRGLGCDFINEKCVGGSAGTQHGFCTVGLAPSAPHPAAASGCTPGHRAKGYCDVETWSGDLPTAYQYFSGEPAKGGSMAEADYCPHFRAWYARHVGLELESLLCRALPSCALRGATAVLHRRPGCRPPMRIPALIRSHANVLLLANLCAPISRVPIARVLCVARSLDSLVLPSRRSNGRCNDAANAPSTSSRGESFGSDADMCFDTTVVTASYVYDGNVNQGCYQTRCSEGVFQIGIALEDTTVEWVSCTEAGAAATPSSTGVSGGSVTCPDYPSLLCNPHLCPGLSCDGTEACVAGVCICGDAFGTECIQTPPAPSSPPRGPPPPAVPPQPPASPGSSYKSVISFSLTIDSTVEAFDSAAFKTSLTALLGNGITAADITLEISSGSVQVAASVIAPSATAASAAANTLSLTSTSDLSASLGVTVTAVTTPTVAVVQFAAPPPPTLPPPMPPSPPPATDMIMIIAIAAGGAAAVLLLVIIIYCVFCKKKKNVTWSSSA